MSSFYRRRFAIIIAQGKCRGYSLFAAVKRKPATNNTTFFYLHSVELNRERALKILGFVAKWLFMLCLPVLLLSASIGVAVNSLWLYEYGFNKYSVSQTTGLAEVELEKAARGIISYFNSDEEYISLTVAKEGKPFVLFNQREVIHLKDVKGLIRLDYAVLLWTLVYGLVYTLTTLLWRKGTYRRLLARGLLGGGGITLFLMLTLGVLALLSFDWFFRQFHLISFANDFWLLDPTRDYLIMLFPGGFWFDAMLFLALCTALGAVVLGGAGGIYLKKAKAQSAREVLA